MPGRSSFVFVVVLHVHLAPLTVARSEAPADDGGKQAANPTGAIRFDRLSNGIATVLGSQRFRSATDQYSICYSGDGRIIATGNSDSINLFDADSGERLKQLRATDPPNYDSFSNVQFIDDNQRLVCSVYPDARVFVWDVDSDKPAVILRAHERNVVDLDISPDERSIATCGDDATIRLWDVATGNKRQEIKLKRAVRDIEFTADGRELYSWCFEEERIRRFDLATAKELATIELPFRQVTLLPGADRFVATDVSGRRIVRGLASPFDELELPKADSHQTVSGISSDGRRIILVQSPSSRHDDPFAGAQQANSPPQLQVWDVQARKLEKVLPFEHVRRHGRVTFSPDGKSLAMTGLQIHRWNLETGQPLPAPEGHSGAITDLEFSADGTMLATISQEDSTLRIWDVASGKLLETFTDTPATAWPEYERSWQARFVAWLNAREVAAMPIKNGVRIWNLNDPTKVRDFPLEFGNDGNGFLTTFTVALNTWAVAKGEHIYLLEPTNGNRTGRLDEHWGAVWQLATTPDGRYLASGSLDRAVVLWDMKTQASKHVLEGVRGSIRSVSLSSDARIVAASSDEGDAVVWNGQTGKVLHHFLKTSDHGASTVAVSADGNLLAAGSNQLRLLDPITGDEKARVTELGAWVHQLAFTPDGSVLAAAIGRGGPVLWNVKRLVSTARDGKQAAD